MRFDLSDEEWAAIEPLLPAAKQGPARVDDRRVLNGIFYILRTGAPWRDLPERYGPRTTVYNRYNRWAQRGIWKGIFDALAQECDDALVFIDASIVRAHRAASGSKRGSYKKLLAAHAEVAHAKFTLL
jgi:transposase